MITTNVLEDSKQEHQGLEIIGCTCTGKLGKNITPRNVWLKDLWK